MSDAVECIVNQTYGNLELLVSVEPTDDANATVAAVMQWTARRASLVVRVFQQPQRLGWTKNINFLLSHARGEFVTTHPHDDLAPPTYVAALVACMQSQPGASVCFPHVRKQHMTTGEVHTWEDPRACCVQLTQFAAMGELIEADIVSHKRTLPYSTVRRFGRQPKSATASALAIGEIQGLRFNEAFGRVNSSLALYHRLRRLATSGHDVSWRPRPRGWDGECERVAAHAFRAVTSARKRVAVLGGGIQGTLVALMMEQRGFDVSLFDQAPRLLRGASSMQEGKIHLGFVYSKATAGDEEDTVRYMMRSALAFDRYMERLLGGSLPWAAWKAAKFHYLVPFDSLQTPDVVERHFAHVQHVYDDMRRADPNASYLGAQPRRLFRRVPVPPFVNQSYFAAAFETEEYSVGQVEFNGAVEAAVYERPIRVLLNSRVTSVSRRHRASHPRDELGKFLVVAEDTSGGGVTETPFDLVVNCLWAGRAAIDRQLGVPLWSGTHVRLKFAVTANQPDSMADWPSFTIINGPFGDFVRLPAASAPAAPAAAAAPRRFYFTWYPLSVIGLRPVALTTTTATSNSSVHDWEQLVSGVIPASVQRAQLAGHEQQFAQLFSVPAGARPFAGAQLRAGFVVANGDTDIGQPDSLIHERGDEPLHASGDGYFSISTQKFTSAPLNTQLFERIL